MEYELVQSQRDSAEIRAVKMNEIKQNKQRTL